MSKLNGISDNLNESLLDLSLENRLLLCAAQSYEEKCSLESDRPVNWDKVLEAAHWHGVMPLLYKTLSRIENKTVIPDYVTNRLEEVYKANLARNMLLFSEFKTVVELLQQKSVEVIVLKGAALASEMYGDIGLRQMSDIDLLVKKEDLPLAETILSDAGYIISDLEEPEVIREKHHHITYVHPDRNIPVELHWHISHDPHPGPLDVRGSGIIEDWWRSARINKISGREVKVLSPENLLIHLCIHFIKHRFLSVESGYEICFISKGALIQLSDIVRTIRLHTDSIDWESMRNKAEDYGVENFLYIVFYIVKEISGDDHVVIGRVNHFLPEIFDNYIAGLMLKKIFEREASFPSVNKLMIKSFGENSFKEGMKNILKIMFPPPEILSEKYSVPVKSMKLYLYYLIRPFDVILRHKKTISDIPRIKDDAALTRWICSQNSASKGNN